MKKMWDHIVFIVQTIGGLYAAYRYFSSNEEKVKRHAKESFDFVFVSVPAWLGNKRAKRIRDKSRKKSRTDKVDG